MMDTYAIGPPPAVPVPLFKFTFAPTIFLIINVVGFVVIFIKQVSLTMTLMAPAERAPSSCTLLGPKGTMVKPLPLLICT